MPDRQDVDIVHDGRYLRQRLLRAERRDYYGKTRREVQLKLTAALCDQQQGVPIAPERETVGQFLTRGLRDVAKPGIRPSTYSSYRDLVELHLIPELGKHGLARLAPQDVQAMMARKLASGLWPRRVQYMRAVLRCALDQALGLR